MMHPNSVPDPKTFRHPTTKALAWIGGGTLLVLAGVMLLASMPSGRSRTDDGSAAWEEPTKHWPIAVVSKSEEETVVDLYNDDDTNHAGILIGYGHEAFWIRGNAKDLIFVNKGSTKVRFQHVVLRYRSMDQETGREFTDVHGQVYVLKAGIPPSEAFRSQVDLPMGFATVDGTLTWEHKDGQSVFTFIEKDANRSWTRDCDRSVPYPDFPSIREEKEVQKE